MLAFSERMPELLAAADALVDSSVGVTCLEALASRFSAGDARMPAASRLTGLPRAQAYAALDLRLARDDAPLVAWGSSYTHDFFSARVGCQVYQPLYGIDIARLCVRTPRKAHG